MSKGRPLPAKSLADGLSWARRAWVVLAWLSGSMLVLSVGFYLYIAFVSYVIEHTGSTFRTGADSAAFQVMLNASGVFDLCLTVLEAVAILVFLRWIWLSVVLARAVNRESVRYAPWVAVVGFLVPIVNYWMPLQVLIDLEAFAAAEEERPVSAFPWYPAGMVFCGFLAYGLWQIVNATPVEGFSNPAASQRLMQIAALGAIAHLVLLMLSNAYMRIVSTGQELALRELAETERLTSAAAVRSDVP
ncbi:MULTISPECIES: DUF4328 domain-containing protein [Alphaproteobacteria]|uniref:DUF4328 domain-containing protein n=2 Tax=Alphaproteobacteria TaxID=28211 RepID=A0A512HHY3_9HYPH|nr:MULTISPECIES: DUF4328 domain-containing protein [Alphaproteobacteria]GEO85062.1 hypothetical protein RNA01_19940 [Ciceribacter naphthalenivorans]GLR24604.1 hypothetical protein GCM10007920_43980 [Ciceribacter naphthalenivorans]GLT07460.1 hypothetical protein GCM10007926_43980 [Sphingomonas psychrolutea]